MILLGRWKLFLGLRIRCAQILGGLSHLHLGMWGVVVGEGRSGLIIQLRVPSLGRGAHPTGTSGRSYHGALLVLGVVDMW